MDIGGDEYSSAGATATIRTQPRPPPPFGQLPALQPTEMMCRTNIYSAQSWQVRTLATIGFDSPQDHRIAGQALRTRLFAGKGGGVSSHPTLRRTKTGNKMGLSIGEASGSSMCREILGALSSSHLSAEVGARTPRRERWTSRFLYGIAQSVECLVP